VYQNLVHDIEAMGFSLASEQGGLLENIRLYNQYLRQSSGINAADLGYLGGDLLD
jgi:hypothetical protein